MRKNKVLLALFAGALALTGGAAQAQFREVGPANIGGHVTSIIVDQQSADESTIYAGAATGGLYVRTTDTSLLGHLYSDVQDATWRRALVNGTDSWHLLRYINPDGYEETLPVSALIQGPDGIIYVGTGDNDYQLGSTYTRMSAKGRGIYRYNPSTGLYSLIAGSTINNDQFGAVREMDYYFRNDSLFFFAATATGLYRWVVTSEADWNSSPALVQAGSVEQLIVVRGLGIAYFTIGNKLYRLGNVALSNNVLNPVDISASNSAFGGKNSAIKIAVAPSDNRYLYAMVIDSAGYMENVYLTTNAQTWTPLATASVLPIGYLNGSKMGAIAVDPSNPKRIYIGGTTLWTGEGFLEGSNYQWTKNSYSEMELNRGDYMSGVFNSAIFVHSGIHKIVPVYVGRPLALSGRDTIRHAYYIATDGGVFSTYTGFNSYENTNRGMNSVQINSIAVSPDGSIISGAMSNACPFIESRHAHNGGNPILGWYDDGRLGNINHDANVIWTGNGGKVAASAFQQINIQPHRNIFVSSANANIGRSFADYLDYTNNQTWTIGEPFLTTEVVGGPSMGSLYLWETDTNKFYQDSVKVGFDLSGYYINANNDTVQITDPTQRLSAGSKGIFPNKSNSDYPFTHTFSQAEVGTGAQQKTVADSFMVQSPIVSRLMAVAKTTASQTSVIYSWTANDFSKIYDAVIDADRNLDPDVKTAMREKFMWWAPIFTVKHSDVLGTTHLYPRNIVMSNDGRFAYISTYDDSTHRSQLVRINGFEQVNFNQYPATIKEQLNAASDTNSRKLRETRFERVGSADGEWFNRPISSIAVDPRPGKDRIVLTFEDYSESYSNVLVIDHASTNSWTANALQLPISGNVGLPAYCAIVEDSTGDIYVGTADGVYIYNGSTWSQYEYLRGVPVTSIVQQTRKFEVKRYTTHTGITENNYLFAKTKWPRAIYFGTYGRGIFMDLTFVTDTTNEISDPSDYNPVNIPSVTGVGQNSVSIFPNPVMGEANINLTSVEAGNAILRIYDLNGRMVVERQLGYVNEGEQLFTVDTEGMAKGMYLVNVIMGGHTAASKMIVR